MDSSESTRKLAKAAYKLSDEDKSQVKEKTEAYLKEVLSKEIKLPVKKIHSQEVFEKYQSDLEWIYVIGNARDTDGRRYLSIYATNWINPSIKTQFVWRVWGSYIQFFDDNTKLGIDEEMRRVNATVDSQLGMLNAYHNSLKQPVKVHS